VWNPAYLLCIYATGEASSAAIVTFQVRRAEFHVLTSSKMVFVCSVVAQDMMEAIVCRPAILESQKHFSDA
jgi:hypothetical protein